MFKRKYLILIIIPIIIFASAFIERNKPFDPLQGLQIDTLAENLRVPWQMVFLPNNDLLFTEREGRVRLIHNNKLLARPLLNLNDVVLRNKSGALGLCLHPEFSTNKQVYLASNYLLGNRMKLRIVRYELENDTLIHPKIILKDIPANQNHTGCRLVFGPDKKLYITTGDADEPMRAQDLKAYNGKILRMNADGSIPNDNPFVKNDTAKHEIWSYGHRNPQGIAFQPLTGLLYETEHGPTGGDEVNLIKKGLNYGWPIAHHDDQVDGMEAPLKQYTPSIGPGEAMFYNGNKFPELKGKFLIACLRGESILNLTLKSGKISDELVFLKKTYGRIRSIVTGPDGYIYFSTSMHDPGEGHPRDAHDDMILRMRPSGNAATTSEKLAINLPNTTKPIRSASYVFQQLCASCHGEKLEGTPTAKGLKELSIRNGNDKKAIVKTITNGITEKGMPAWGGAISKAEIDQIADFILSKNKR